MKAELNKLSLIEYIDKGGQNEIFLVQEPQTQTKFILKKAMTKKNIKFE